MGRASPDFDTLVVEIVLRHVGGLREGAVSVRASSGGSYVSVTVTVQAESQTQLDALYRSAEPPQAQRVRKSELMAQMRAEYQSLKASRWGGFAGYDRRVQRAHNAPPAGVGAQHRTWPPSYTLFDPPRPRLLRVLS